MELRSNQTCTLDSHLHRVTYTRCRINTIDSPDYEHKSARNMQRIGINIYKEGVVRQVGYLQELNRDARSTEHAILRFKNTSLDQYEIWWQYTQVSTRERISPQIFRNLETRSLKCSPDLSQQTAPPPKKSLKNIGLERRPDCFPSWGTHKSRADTDGYP